MGLIRFALAVLLAATTALAVVARWRDEDVSRYGAPKPLTEKLVIVTSALVVLFARTNPILGAVAFLAVVLFWGSRLPDGDRASQITWLALGTGATILLTPRMAGGHIVPLTWPLVVGFVAVVALLIGALVLYAREYGTERDANKAARKLAKKTGAEPPAELRADQPNPYIRWLGYARVATLVALVVVVIA